jgi:hypothetical protein
MQNICIFAFLLINSMKKILWCATVAGAMFLQSCEEKGVKIDFGDPDVKVKDTSYVAAVEAAQPRVVLVEEFTGASCTNCPAGHTTVANILNANPNRVVAVAYHTFGQGSIFKPVSEAGHESKYDFRDTAATDIGNNILGVGSSIPVAAIDRVPYPGGTSLVANRTSWVDQTGKRKDIATGVNLYLTSKYDADKNQVTVSVKVAYTSATSKKTALTIGVIESDIIDAQAYPDHVQEDYEHNHVWRKLLTPLYTGASIRDNIATKDAGFVYEYTYTFEPATSWKLENCQIVAWVANNEPSDKEVLQAIEVHLK